MDEKGSNRYRDNLAERNLGLQREITRLKSKPGGGIGWIILGIGAILLAVSMDYYNSLAAFIALTLVFWGIVVLYTRPVRYVRKEIMESIILDMNNVYHYVLNESDFDGIPLYISPKTLSNINDVYLLIIKEIDDNISMEKISSVIKGEENDDSFIKITPIGIGLSNLIEKDSGLNFSVIDIPELSAILKKFLVEEYELAKDINLKVDYNIISVNIKGNIFNKIIDENDKNKNDYLNSTIICSIAKSIHKPIIINNIIKDYENSSTLLELKIL